MTTRRECERPRSHYRSAGAAVERATKAFERAAFASSWAVPTKPAAFVGCLNGKQHGEFRKHVGLRIDRNQPAVELDQAARDVEAEAGGVGPRRRVVLDRLGMRERIEDALAIFLGDADAVVAHAQPRPAAGVALARRFVDADRDLARLPACSGSRWTRGSTAIWCSLSRSASSGCERLDVASRRVWLRARASGKQLGARLRARPRRDRRARGAARRCRSRCATRSSMSSTSRLSRCALRRTEPIGRTDVSAAARRTVPRRTDRGSRRCWSAACAARARRSR